MLSNLILVWLLVSAKISDAITETMNPGGRASAHSSRRLNHPTLAVIKQPELRARSRFPISETPAEAQKSPSTGIEEPTIGPRPGLRTSTDPRLGDHWVQAACSLPPSQPLSARGGC